MALSRQEDCSMGNIYIINMCLTIMLLTRVIKIFNQLKPDCHV